MVRDPALLLRLRGIQMIDDTSSDHKQLPLWKASEKLEEFITRIYRRVHLY
jgi:hypothetical protein